MCKVHMGQLYVLESSNFDLGAYILPRSTMHGLSLSSRSLSSSWSLFVASLLNHGTGCTQSVVYWSLSIHIRGCGQFCTDILAHLRFKCIISRWFWNRCMKKPASTVCVHGTLASSPVPLRGGERAWYTCSVTLRRILSYSLCSQIHIRVRVL